VIGAGGIGAELSYLSMAGTSPARSPARRAAIVSPFGSSCASKVACDAPVTSERDGERVDDTRRRVHTMWLADNANGLNPYSRTAARKSRGVVTTTRRG
jgi:hypothetical protein